MDPPANRAGFSIALGVIVYLQVMKRPGKAVFILDILPGVGDRKAAVTGNPAR